MHLITNHRKLLFLSIAISRISTLINREEIIRTCEMVIRNPIIRKQSRCLLPENFFISEYSSVASKSYLKRDVVNESAVFMRCILVHLSYPYWYICLATIYILLTYVINLEDGSVDAIWILFINLSNFFQQIWIEKRRVASDIRIY